MVKSATNFMKLEFMSMEQLDQVIHNDVFENTVRRAALNELQHREGHQLGAKRDDYATLNKELVNSGYRKNAHSFLS